MIKANLASNPKILIVYDKAQSKKWVEFNRTTSDGIIGVLQRFNDNGLDPVDEVSVVSLCDSTAPKPKAAAYKEKKEYIDELIEEYGFNVIVPIGAVAFEKIMGHKGIEKFYGKVLESTVYPKQKVIPCPNPSVIKYKPEIKPVLDNTFKLIASQKDSADIVEEVKIDTHYTIIDTIGKAEAFFKAFAGVNTFAYDTETTGFCHKSKKILMAQFTHKVGYSYLIPTDWYDYWTKSEWKWIVSEFRKLFKRKDILIIGHNLKFDLKFTCHQWKIPVPDTANMMDTMYMSFLADENTPNDLKFAACTITDLGDYDKELDVFKKAYCKKNKMKVGEFHYDLIPFEILAKYALVDTDAAFRLYQHFLPILEDEDMLKPLYMLIRFMRTATKMEMQGWPVDVEYGNEYLIELTKKIEVLKIDLLAHPKVEEARGVLEVLEIIKENKKRVNPITKLKTPFEFKLTSPKQKSVLFFEILGLPIIKYTKARDENGKQITPSTDKECVEEWLFKYPLHSELLQMISTYNELCKMRSTYVEGILSKVIDGRIHPTYNITGAATGRLSSSNPNFQNIPVRNAEAKNVKRMIFPQHGWVIMGADLGAAEMRYACVCSGDKKLEEIFNAGVDIDGAIAVEVFGLSCDANDVKWMFPELRNISKTIQFLSLYGGGAQTLSTKIKITPDRSKAILEEIMVEVGVAEDTGVLNKKGKPTYRYPKITSLKGNAEAADLMVEKFQIEVSAAHRVLASRKPINALMTAFQKDKDECQVILDNYFAKYPGVKQYIDDTIEFTKRTGYSLSLLGRKRRVPAVASTDKGVIERAVRQAVNSTIQSVASDGLMFSACDIQENFIDCWDEIAINYGIEGSECPIRMMGVVHDAIYFEVRVDFILQAKEIIEDAMGCFPDVLGEVSIPMVADAEHGASWAETSEKFDNLREIYKELFEDEDE